MLKLYNKEHEAISAILNIKDYKIEYLLSGEDSLEFSLSISDENINLLQEECYIRNELNEYVVKEIDPSNDFKRFNCILNLEDIKAKSIFNFETENNNIDDTIRLAIAGTGWVLVDSNITKRRTVRLKNTNALEVLREIRKVFKIDYRFDSINKKIYVYEQYGSDKGVYFSDELNLTDLKFPSDTYEYITRIIPIGKDSLKISSVNGGKEYIDNFQYTNKVIEYIWEDNRYTDAQSLKDDAIAKLNELSKPKKVYEANVYDLAKYSDEYNFLEFFLGDTITILSKKDNFKDKQRIVKYIQYPKEPYKNTCELGNTTLTFEELQQENEYKNQVLNNITTDNNTLDGSKVDKISTNQIRDFDVEVGRVVNLEVVNAKIDNLVATDVNITGQLNAVKADIGTLNTNVANIDELVVKHTATINELNSNKANINDLNATNAIIYILESKVANIDHILAGNITADNIQAGTITAGSGIIADGAIGSAQISSLDASKISAGTIDTSRVTVAGPNSNLKISGNRLQVFQGTGTQQVERVSLGDVNNDGSVYGFRVRGADGQTVLMDENGVKREGITDGSINNDKIAGNANIDGSKLNINSVVNKINEDGTNVIRGTKIEVDGTSLTTKLSTIVNKQTADGQKIFENSAKIAANESAIRLKVDSQTYQTDKSNMTTQMNKNTSAINLLQDEIALKVEQSDITNAINNLEVGGRNLLRNTNFTSNNDFWGNTGSATLTIVDDSTFGKVGKIVCSQSSTGITNRTTIALDNQKEYTMSCYIKSNVNARVGLALNDSGLASAKYFNITPTWTKIETTFVNNNVNAIPRIYLAENKAVEVYVANVKFEKGNKVTDWTPAPEDVDSAIVAVDSKTTTINNRVSEITADLNGITQRVSATETTTTNLNNKIDNIQVGGRNLIIRSRETKNTGVNIVGDITVMNGCATSDYIEVTPDEVLAFSKKNSSTTDGYFRWAWYSSDKTYINREPNNSHSFLWTVPKEAKYIRVSYPMDAFPKVERGNKVTDWSPAPEDTQNDIDNIDSKITTTNSKVATIETNLNSITSRVSNVETTTTTIKNQAVQSKQNIRCNDLGIKINYADFTNTNAGELYLHGYDANNNPADINGKIYWNGQALTVVKGMINPGNSIPVNTDVYIFVNKTSSSSSIFGTYYDTPTKTWAYIQFIGGTASGTGWTPGQHHVAIGQFNMLSAEEFNYAYLYETPQSLTNLIIGTINILSRMNTAESQITEEAITNTVKKQFYTKTETDSAITSKGYLTSSQVQQKVDQLQIKFTQSGGYNLVRNSNFTKELSYWSNWGTCTKTVSNSSSGYKKSLQITTTDTNQGVSQSVSGLAINREYTLSAYVYVSSGQGQIQVYNGVSYYSASTTQAGWQWLTVTFTAKEESITVYLGRGGKGSNGTYSFTAVTLEEGALRTGWSPHPNEIYDGITTIDKDGITVTSSNVKSKTSMTASGFKITKTDTNEDVFKVNSDGTLSMTGSITTKTSGARSILTGDGINFYNGNTHVGKVSYDTLGAGTVEEARERLWLRSLGGYALKIQSSGDMSLEANGTYNTIFMKGNSLKVTAPTYIYGNLFLNNNNIYAANNVEIKGTLSASSNINVSGKIKAMGNIEINKGTIYLPAGGGNNTAEFIRLANCFMAAVTNSMHFVDINGNKSYLYAASVNTYSLLNNNETLTRSNETALSLMENISVINTSNGYQLKPKYKERTIGESSTGITLKYDEKNKCEAVEVNINKVINILWKAILELKQEYDSFKNTIIEN